MTRHNCRTCTHDDPAGIRGACALWSSTAPLTDTIAAVGEWLRDDARSGVWVGEYPPEETPEACPGWSG